MEKKIIYNVKKEKGLSEAKLKKLLKEWQKKLLMNDWNLSLEIVDFKRKDYRQSGDFTADPKKRKAVILLTKKPRRGNEKYTLVHEMIHVLIYDFDKYNESLLLKKYKKFGKEHNAYLEKLESMVHRFAKLILKK